MLKIFTKTFSHATNLRVKCYLLRGFCSACVSIMAFILGISVLSVFSDLHTKYLKQLKLADTTIWQRRL